VALERLGFGETLGLLWRGKRAYWALNLANFGDGVAYFGFLTLLVPFLNTRLLMTDPVAGLSVSLFTGLVALFMLNGGRIADRMGVRKALGWSLATSALGRGLLTASPSLGLGVLGNQFARLVGPGPDGLWGGRGPNGSLCGRQRVHRGAYRVAGLGFALLHHESGHCGGPVWLPP
jgi:dipeptide/tripeptide permease